MNIATNLISIIDAKKSLNGNSLTYFLDHHNIKVKQQEFVDLEILCDELKASGLIINEFDNFYFGYEIEQIGKEFDLIKFDKKSLINIEIKSQSTDEKISKQLIRNKYYLSFLEKDVKSFTFITSTRQFYSLNDKENLEIIDIKEIIIAIQNIDTYHNEEINSIFNPSDYLVSPFNSTEKFLKNKYFLTNHQEKIANKISLKIDKGRSFTSVSGGPGTGKTLLIYDIAKNAQANGKKVLIIHCGNLNHGQLELNKAGFKIIPAKDIDAHLIDNWNLIIVDETQRIYTNQLVELIKKVKNYNIPCVFSHDSKQTLANIEIQRNISEKLLNNNVVEKFELTDKIRSNAEISNFIKMFLNKNRNIKMTNGKNVLITYFDNSEKAREYCANILSQHWKLIRLTPSLRDNEYHEKFYCGYGETSHSVIGQEFDGVTIIIDDMFSYSEVDGDLFYRKKTYYNPMKMIFQNITRTKKRLNIVIVKNEEVMDRCMYILSNK